ncbi:hypothetical protein Tco_0350178, partial [Tanacetum coccineum]
GLAAAAADELSPVSYLGPRVIPNLFQGGKVTSGMSSLRSVESKCKGSVPDDGASGLVWESMMGGGNGSEWEVLVMIRVVVARESEVVVVKVSGEVVMTMGRAVMMVE